MSLTTAWQRDPAGADTLTRVVGEALAATGHQQVAVKRSSWTRRYVLSVLTADVVLSGLAGLIGYLARFAAGGSPSDQSRYAVATVVFPALFVGAIASCRAYEPRFLGAGSDEYRRVFDGALRLAALGAIAAVAFHVAPARGYFLVAFPAAVVLVLFGRYAARRILEAQRRRGRCMQRVVVLGRERSVAELVRTVRRDSHAGFQIVGACLDTASPRDAEQVEGVPIFGGPRAVIGAIRATNADTVAITAFSDMDTTEVRRLGWQLEGSDVAMLVAPRITDVAGPRIHIRPVAGLPLLHVEQPELTGGRRLLKACIDRSVAAMMLIALLPLLCAIGLTVRFTSPGPAIFRQRRVGTAGTVFTLWKFRTMYANAEDRLGDLNALNAHGDGPLFKIVDDPRITPIGRWLRRFSLDELPQLVQVLTGKMSLVGPRPPLPSEVRRYENSVHRRLLVKPGLTGLWQISGRSDLSWNDTVRLDLHYVENWSLALDLTILFRTASAVLARRGAY
ncbi:MAG TPA: sugar transferase [Mycobacteriales bacterium]|nr:sugar transferase [Mycobacteriales bacterium]